MGKKKKGKKVTVQKRVYKIPKFFECPFCGRKDGIKITISQKEKTAQLHCMSCGRGEPDPITIGPLTEPIDVYDDFIDRTRESNKEYNANFVEHDFSSDNDMNKASDSDVEYDNTKMRKTKDVSDSNDSDSDLDSENSSNKSDSDLLDSDKSESD